MSRSSVFIALITALLTATGCNDDRRPQQGGVPISTSHSEAQLQKAAMDGNLSLVRACLDAGIDVNGGSASAEGAATPLSLAALGAHPSVVSALLDAGADPNKPADALGRTPLMIAARKGDAASVRVLIKANASVNAADRDGFTALMSAIAGNCTECVWVLIDAGADVQAKTSDKCECPSCTALDIAARKADLSTIQAVIDAGAVVPYKASLLHLAVAFKRQDLVQTLFARRADVNARDSHGRTPLHYDQLASGAGDNVKAVIVNGQMQLVGTEATITKILLEAGADVNAQDDQGQTALHLASISFHEDRIRRLIAAGADPSIKEASGLTPVGIFQRFWESAPRPTLANADPRVDQYTYQTQVALLEGRDPIAAGEAVLRGSHQSRNAAMRAVPRPPDLVVQAVMSSGNDVKALIGRRVGRRIANQKTVKAGDLVESSGVTWEVVEVKGTEQSVVLKHRESGASHVVTTAR